MNFPLPDYKLDEEQYADPQEYWDQLDPEQKIELLVEENTERELAQMVLELQVENEDLKSALNKVPPIKRR